MPDVINGVRSYASIMEEAVRLQAEKTARMKFVHPFLALMPDCHLGKGATVGSVIPTVAAIMPAAVGVDIGCGMIAVRTGLVREQFTPEISRRVHAEILSRVPVSAGKYRTKFSPQAAFRTAQLKKLAAEAGFDPADYDASWESQLGTLGSGNHFIEISSDENNNVWMFLHSGSRGIGNKIAQAHIKQAVKECKLAEVKLEDPDLAYLTEGTDSFDRYIRELFWAQEFALQNREQMMYEVKQALYGALGMVLTYEKIQCHHNYTENKGTYWLSRKGAINAEEGVLGLIPGSMGAASYVVRGKGNEESLWSAPHGAGRNFSRSAAKREFTREDLNERMKDIVWGESDAFIDEHPNAYKDIDVVMNDSRELVDIVHIFSQFINCKGD